MRYKTTHSDGTQFRLAASSFTLTGCTNWQISVGLVLNLVFMAWHWSFILCLFVKEKLLFDYSYRNFILWVFHFSFFYGAWPTFFRWTALWAYGTKNSVDFFLYYAGYLLTNEKCESETFPHRFDVLRAIIILCWGFVIVLDPPFHLLRNGSPVPINCRVFSSKIHFICFIHIRMTYSLWSNWEL